MLSAWEGMMDGPPERKTLLSFSLVQMNPYLGMKEN